MASSLAATAIVASLAAGPAVPAPSDFTVLRDGTPIGTHRIRAEQVGDETRVSVEIDLRVKIAFITVYRYAHRNRETWRGDRLVAIDTRTDDNGTEQFVRGRATPTGFAVESSSGSRVLPADIIPTSYWRPIPPDQTKLLDTQQGRLLDIRVRREAGGTVAAGLTGTQYSVRGDLDLDLWYDAASRLRRIAFDYKGSRFDYSEQTSPSRFAGGS